MSKWDLNDLDDRLKEAIGAGKKLVDALPQEQQDMIHAAERQLRDKRDAVLAKIVDWLLDAIIPENYQGLAKAILAVILRKVLTDKLLSEVAK